MKAVVAAVLAVGLVAPGVSQAATVVDAKSVVVTSAMGDYLQIGELLAFTFGGANVALATNGGVASAASQYGPEGGPAEANDGAYPVNYDYPVGGGTAGPGVYHSAGTGPGEFLRVTFQSLATLSSLTIYGRGDCCQGRDRYNVSIRDASDNEIFATTLDATDPSVGYATVTFDQPGAAVPEPSAWALMIMGFGAAGAAFRRQRALRGLRAA